MNAPKLTDREFADRLFNEACRAESAARTALDYARNCLNHAELGLAAATKAREAIAEALQEMFDPKGGES